MTVHDTRGALPARAEGASILHTVEVPQAELHVEKILEDALRGCDPAHLLVFSSERQTFERICHAAGTLYPGASQSGCTTAGQLGRRGYDDENAVVIALPARHFATCTVTIRADDLDDGQRLVDRLVQARARLQTANPEKRNGFAFLLVDGLSLREDILAASIAPAMGSWPLFGGSSGDGTRFEKTRLGVDGAVTDCLALLTFAVTDCDTHVFSLNHLTPTARKMVVTSADPERRIVKEINAEPAGREYARIVNRDPEQLDEFTFSAFPVVVQLGDTYHVRSIQRVNENGELVFFAAIDEGMVLTLAEPENLARHLERELAHLVPRHRTAEVLACDCILRRIEAGQTQTLHDVSEVLMRNRVVGFSTYGEQIGPLHVNHTMTGVVLSRPHD